MANSQANSQKLQAIHADIVISGGGVVGCLAALAIAKHTSLSIALVEASEHTSATSKHASHAGFDARVIALAAQSVELLAQLGVDIDAIAHHPIKRIHVSDRGHIGQVQLTAKDVNVDALGKVVAIDLLGAYLLAAIESISQIQIIRPATIQKVETRLNNNCITLRSVDAHNKPTTELIECRLLLISDGGQSATRDLLGFTSQQIDYEQTAIISNVRTQLPHNGVAFERFTSQGPIAFLPMQVTDDTSNEGSYMSVVWCVDRELSNAKMALSDTAFMAELHVLFGDKLGKIEACSQRFSYPLVLSKASSFVQHRAICIGNAAQSLHPIAGQGFNLGIRDVFALVSTLNRFQDPGSFECVQAYKALRLQDKKMTINATDALVRFFSNQYLPMVVGRNLGLLTLNKMNSLKQAFAKLAMGARSDKL